MLNTFTMECSSMYKCILTFISWFDFNENSSLAKRICSSTLKISMVLLFMDSMVLGTLLDTTFQWKGTLELLLCAIFSFVSLYGLLRKKKDLNTLLAIVNNPQKSSSIQKFNALSGIILLLLIIYPFLTTTSYYTDEKHEHFKTNTYNINFKYEWVRFGINYIKILNLYIIHPIIPSIITVLY